MHEPAKEPNDLERFFVERANAGDLEGLLALYEADATIADGKGAVAVGKEEIRTFLARFWEECPRFPPSRQSPALLSADIALTSSRLSNGEVTAEVARRQADGSWLWVVDQFAL